MTFCTACGKENHDDSLCCYACGASLKSPSLLSEDSIGSNKSSKKSPSKVKIVIAIVAVVLLIFAVSLYVSGGSGSCSSLGSSKKCPLTAADMHNYFFSQANQLDFRNHYADKVLYISGTVQFTQFDINTNSYWSLIDPQYAITAFWQSASQAQSIPNGTSIVALCSTIGILQNPDGSLYLEWSGCKLISYSSLTAQTSTSNSSTTSSAVSSPSNIVRVSSTNQSYSAQTWLYADVSVLVTGIVIICLGLILRRRDNQRSFVSVE